MTAELDMLLAKQAIMELQYRYCRALDRMDKEGALSIWHPGAVVDYGGTFQGTARDFMEEAWKIHAGMNAHRHQVTNILIEVSGDDAVSESYATAALRYSNADGVVEQLTVRVRYLDRISRRDGVWAIDERRCIHDFSDVAEIKDSGVASPATRDGRDPSWLFFKAPGGLI
jgi:hypothetical protein